MFSGYSQVLRSNAEMTAINSVRQQLNSAAQTLSAASSLDAGTGTILNPPAVMAYGSVTDTARLPSGYAGVNGTGSPDGYGVISPSVGVRQLDPWGKYYIYCQWNSAIATATLPSISVISAGPDGVLQTKCGDNAAQGDDRINKLSVAEAVNRANVWQVNGASQVKYGAAANAVQVNSDGSMTAASLTLSTPLALTSGGTGANSAALARINLSVPATDGTNATGTWGIGITGNAGTATALQTARNFSIAGTTGLTAANVSFNGSADVALALTGTLAVANGGTGGATAAAARTNLAVLGTANNLSDVANAATARTNLAVLGIANNLSDLNNVATARTNLGLGTMATQNANAVAITGGTITGVTITGNVSGSAGSVAASALTGCCVPLSAGGTGVNATSNTNLRNQLGIDNASNLLSGQVAQGLLGTGAHDNTVFLRGDGVWAVVPTGVSALSALSDVTLTSPTNGQVLQYNGTKWVNATGAGITAGGTAPSFSVNKGGTAQTVTALTDTQLTWSAASFDTNNNFNLSTGAYTPTIAGKYLVTLNVYCTAAPNYCSGRIRKNGTIVAYNYLRASNSDDTLTAIIDMNGTSDTLTVSALSDNGTSIDGTSTRTYFAGALLAPLASGSVAGTGTASYIPMWSNSTNLTNSALYQSGGNVGIGTTSPGSRLTIVNDNGPDAADDVLISSYTTNTSPGFVGQKAHGTYAAPSPIQSGDWGVALVGAGYNGSSFPVVGIVAAMAENTWTTTASTNNGALIFGTTAAGTWSEKMRITSAGNVGIGATSPGALFDVNGSAIIGGNTEYTLGNQTNILQLNSIGTSAAGPQVAITGWGNQTGYGGNFKVYHSRGGAIGTQGALQAGDELGVFDFGGSDGTSMVDTAFIFGMAGSTWTTANHESYLSFRVTPNGSTGAAEQMRLTGAGYLGIGTPSPQTLFNLNSTAPSLSWSRSGTLEAQILDYSDGNIYIDYKNNTYFRNGINGAGSTSPLTLLSTGAVGIGTTSPGSTLDVAGTGNFTGTVTAATPTASTHLATKAYVDTAVAGASGGSGGAPTNFQVFASSGTWTKPGSGSMAKVECWGGGGGGGGGGTYYSSFWVLSAGAGGGGGGSAYAWFPLSSLTSTVTVTIGAGGAGGAGSGSAVGSAGSTGSSTTFGGYLTATGGSGGTGAASSPGGVGGYGSGTNVFAFPGSQGGVSPAGALSTPLASGTGGLPGFPSSGSGAAAVVSSAGTAGVQPGNGGSGGSGSSRAGGAGGAGECVVTTY
ncbi:MAG: beta strand repeat-containing protein [Rhodomicrobium sp.]